MKPFLQCSWTFDTEAWAFSISTGNFHFVRASVPERLALPASNVAVGSVFNLDFPILYVLYGNKELTLSSKSFFLPNSIQKLIQNFEIGCIQFNKIFIQLGNAGIDQGYFSGPRAIVFSPSQMGQLVSLPKRGRPQ